MDRRGLVYKLSDLPTLSGFPPVLAQLAPPPASLTLLPSLRTLPDDGMLFWLPDHDILGLYAPGLTVSVVYDSLAKGMPMGPYPLSS